MARWGSKEPESSDESTAEDSTSEESTSEGSTSENSTSEDSNSGDSTSLEDQSLPPAPSLGPNTTIENKPTSEAVARNQPSETDAMGLDKRREVIGGSYGPSKARVVGTFTAVLSVIAIIAIGFFLLAKELDQPPETNVDAAPWSAPDAQQRPPKQLQ